MEDHEMKEMNGVKIIGVDHGYGNLQSVLDDLEMFG